MKDILEYPSSQQLQDAAYRLNDEIKKFESEWKKNPLHWTNNKRRMHGLGALRGKANRKDRFEPPKFYVQQKMSELIPLLEMTVNEVLKDKMYEDFDMMANIKDVPYGHKAYWSKHDNRFK